MEASSPLSSFVLTRDSEKHLDKVLSALKQCTDEIIVLDSGSTDQTEAIAKKHGAKFVFRKFDNFKNQRQYGLDICKHQYVLMIDSDEIVDDEMIRSVNELRQKGFTYDLYKSRRKWFVQGKAVHAMYPVKSPDTVMRLVNTKKVSYKESRLVHEQISGFDNFSFTGGHILHYTFETEEEYQRKIEMYGYFGAKDYYEQGVEPSFIRRQVFPLLLWAKWYFAMGSWKDGVVGWRNARFVYQIVKYKYKVMKELKQKEQSHAASA